MSNAVTESSGRWCARLRAVQPPDATVSTARAETRALTSSSAAGSSRTIANFGRIRLDHTGAGESTASAARSRPRRSVTRGTREKRRRFPTFADVAAGLGRTYLGLAASQLETAKESPGHMGIFDFVKQGTQEMCIARPDPA